MSQTTFLEFAHENLYWPSPEEIWRPSGSGAKVYAELVSKKIGQKLIRERQDAHGVKVGILAANPNGNDTQVPIAIVCEFASTVSNETISETHRLAWSFSRASSLITIEPSLLRVWTCCEHPESPKYEVPVVEITDLSLSVQAAQALQWVELVSGEFFQKNEKRFKKSGSADQMLLSNLKEVRQQLYSLGLKDYATIHDLLGRVIFIEFLFQKKDSNSNSALNCNTLQKLYNDGVLSTVYKNFSEILENFDDTYQLFRWLNNKFNGDLFPGKGESATDRESEWQAEIEKVKTKDNLYLKKLAQFIRGDLEMQSGQMSLWKYYSFDVIPLDFISSVYEEFVSKKPDKGVHYTPEHLVDFILDGVLPWNKLEWDIKILDPCCGSGIFLVKAFQRLIYRWSRAYSHKIQAQTLKYLLENNLFGIDIDPEAVRVASFSLYMMMLDNIDPLEYWDSSLRFPQLRNRRLICADFFEEDKEGFRTNIDEGIYDLVVGNAPWGKNSITSSHEAKAWENKPEHNGKWETSYGNIAFLFLPKAAALTKPGGHVAMMQPAMSMLFNQTRLALEFRHNIFKEFKVEEIVNLSALRFGLFKKAISPTCIITLRVCTPTDEPFTYICPKSSALVQDDYKIVIEPQDINYIYPCEVEQMPFIWSTLMWGGKRDLSLVNKLLKQENFETLVEKNIAKARQGIIRGNRRKIQNTILKRRILKSTNFPDDTFIFINPNDLPINNDPSTDGKASTDFSAFEVPQIIIKQSWQINSSRFKAAIVKATAELEHGVICSESYVNVHVPEDQLTTLIAACFSYNSKLAVYFLFLISGRFASFIPEVKPKDLLRVPIPKQKNNLLDTLEKTQNFEDIDKYIQEAFSFKDSEWLLIEDIFNCTLPDFKGDKTSPGKKATQRQDEPQLKDYCHTFLRVLKSGFGQNKQVSAKIFQEHQSLLPVRLVAIYLNYYSESEVGIETINSQLLMKRLNRLNILLQQESPTDGGIFYQRVTRIYDSTVLEGVQVPTIYLIKPDKVRYWTRSMALRDADEVSVDIMLGNQN